MRILKIFILCSFCCLLACTSSSSAKSSKKANHKLLDKKTFLLKSTAVAASYGYSQRNPVKVGGGSDEDTFNQTRYMNALLGPQGEIISYRLKGSCCYYKTKDGQTALLEQYEISYGDPVIKTIIFLTSFETDELKAPKGFTFKE